MLSSLIGATNTITALLLIIALTTDRMDAITVRKIAPAMHALMTAIAIAPPAMALVAVTVDQTVAGVKMLKIMNAAAIALDAAMKTMKTALAIALDAAVGLATQIIHARAVSKPASQIALAHAAKPAHREIAELARHIPEEFGMIPYTAARNNFLL